MAFRLFLGICVLLPMLPASSVAAADDAGARPLPTRDEARKQAELLHDVLHATLQEVHDRYFREDEKIPIPAVAFKTVFEGIEARRKIKLSWMAVNTQAMNVDHEPRSEFEKAAVKAFAAGAEEFEELDGAVYRRAGSIDLRAECLKCHLPLRSNNKTRRAALMIEIPVRSE